MPMHHLFRHIIVEDKRPFPVRQVVRKPYLCVFIIFLEAGFQKLGGSCVHGSGLGRFLGYGFWGIFGQKFLKSRRPLSSGVSCSEVP
ncbi:hypothetical protein MSSIH_0535 [Methanosarcina siciliae HI350]|uniref:Uncharacterized protein n=1 Tax=Methanosarcina siciliae HI350 TaxID=1434119 RepID=A0A0E3PAV4_9EURY|nr:hypothetical protein MSSIH_0535 [Methanosarcina siciliae HI350]